MSESQTPQATQDHTNAKSADRYDAAAFTRPDPALLKYYLWVSLCTLILFPFAYLASYLRYRSLRYQFDEEGVSVAWGVLNRREIVLTYRRIQDIHVRRNLFHRWAGIATLEIQTASGAAGAEMTIEGVREPDRLRDYLYLRMRGARDDDGEDAAAPEEQKSGSETDEAMVLLMEIRDALRSARLALENSASETPTPEDER